MTNYQSQNIVYGQAFADTVMAAFKTVPGGALIASAAKLRLSQDPSFNPSPGSTIASLASGEANYSGYTAGGLAVVQTGPVNTSPSCQAMFVPGVFVATTGSPFVPNSVTGYWIDDGTNVIMGERFAGGATATFAEAGDFLVVSVLLPEQELQATS